MIALVLAIAVSEAEQQSGADRLKASAPTRNNVLDDTLCRAPSHTLDAKLFCSFACNIKQPLNVIRIVSVHLLV